MTDMKSQLEIYRAVRQVAECDMLFLKFVSDGLTREELETNIKRRPSIWARYATWIDKLPTTMVETIPLAD